MAISIVQLGTPRRKGEGLRIGTVRRPPRGVPKSQYAKQDWYDVWLPSLSPTASLLRSSRIGVDGAGWGRFARRFLVELKRPDQSHLLDVLAALSHSSPLAIGCYCADESRCHRSILRRALEERGAIVKSSDAGGRRRRPAR